MTNKPIILIVDDLPENILTIKLTLKYENYEFIEASNGLEAIEQVKKYNPDVILMDAVMPDMDGFEATKNIRKLENSDRTPILMISSLTKKEDKISAIAAGVNDFITKPFDNIEVVSRCRSYINMTKLNKKYILASKNQMTNLPNKNALLEDLKIHVNPKLLLAKIEDYELLEEFYSTDITEQIELELSKVIKNFFPQELTVNQMYHISEGEFAFILDDIYDLLTDDIIYELFDIFLENVKNHIISFNGYEYDISLLLSYSYGQYNLFEYARVGINHIIKQDKQFVIANDIIKSVKANTKKNINTIQMIKEAIVNNNIVSFYQPIYNNKTEKIEKYESLVRLINSDNKIIAPSDFLEISKKGRYYSHITKTVIDNALFQLKNTTNSITINLSAFDVDNRNTRIHLLKAFGDCPDISNRLTFELLEDEIFKNYHLLNAFISDAKHRGIKIAIDDFGTGYSNFERLQDFQPDILKIDGSLIKNITTNSYCRKIVETIQSFADKINVKTVAEFVADEEIYNIVRKIGIDYSQGYYLGKPEKDII